MSVDKRKTLMKSEDIYCLNCDSFGHLMGQCTAKFKKDQPPKRKPLTEPVGIVEELRAEIADLKKQLAEPCSFCDKRRKIDRERQRRKRHV